jgi:hypothetical protein
MSTKDVVPKNAQHLAEIVDFFLLTDAVTTLVVHFGEIHTRLEVKRMATFLSKQHKRRFVDNNDIEYCVKCGVMSNNYPMLVKELGSSLENDDDDVSDRIALYMSLPSNRH